MKNVLVAVIAVLLCLLAPRILFAQSDDTTSGASQNAPASNSGAPSAPDASSSRFQPFGPSFTEATVVHSAWAPVHAHGGSVAGVGSFSFPTPITFSGLLPPPKTALLLSDGPEKECLFFFPLQYQEAAKQYLLKHPAYLPLQKGAYIPNLTDSDESFDQSERSAMEKPHAPWDLDSTANLSSGESVHFEWSFGPTPSMKEEKEEIEGDSDPFDYATITALFRPGAPLRNQRQLFVLSMDFVPFGNYHEAIPTRGWAESAWEPVYTHGEIVTQVGSYKLPAPVTFSGLAPPPKTALLVSDGQDTTCFFYLPVQYEETVKRYLSKYPESVPLKKGSYASSPKNPRIYVFKKQKITREHPNPQWADGSEVRLPTGGRIRYSWLFALFEKATPEQLKMMGDPFVTAVYQGLMAPDSPVKNQQWQFNLAVIFSQEPIPSRNSQTTVKSSWEPVTTQGSAVTQVGSFKLPTPATFSGLLPPPISALLLTAGSETECDFFFSAAQEESVRQYLQKHTTSVPVQKGSYISDPKDASFNYYQGQQLTKDQPHPQWFLMGDVDVSGGEYTLFYQWMFIRGPDGGKNTPMANDTFSSAMVSALFQPDCPVINEPWIIAVKLHFLPKP